MAKYVRLIPLVCGCLLSVALVRMIRPELIWQEAKPVEASLNQGHKYTTVEDWGLRFGALTRELPQAIADSIRLAQARGEGVTVEPFGTLVISDLANAEQIPVLAFKGGAVVLIILERTTAPVPFGLLDELPGVLLTDRTISGSEQSSIELVAQLSAGPCLEMLLFPVPARFVLPDPEGGLPVVPIGISFGLGYQFDLQECAGGEFLFASQDSQRQSGPGEGLASSPQGTGLHMAWGIGQLPEAGKLLSLGLVGSPPTVELRAFNALTAERISPRTVELR